ncbi:MAG: folylpolyglutamate synthase/dihydrofolate synthase family protein [Oscillospiraceae bacterium]
MTYKKAEEYIHSLEKFGSKLGLERITTLLNYLGNPHKKLKFVHIAGTNGKGSTVAMSSKILRYSGYKVGMYISPFVIDFRERFQINGKMIEKQEFADLIERIKPFADKMEKNGEQVTEYEIITALAFLFYYQNKCDIVCLEVGLGGTYDATNVIDTPLVAIIASISLDHTTVLGNTIAQIAAQKAGIIKKNTTVVTYPCQETDAISVFMEQCEKTSSTLIVPNSNNVEILEDGILGSKFIYGTQKYSLKLIGTHQIYNAIAVIEGMRVLAKKGFAISEENIKKGLKSATFPARFEIFSKSPVVILDGAHNSQAALSLANSLDKLKVSRLVCIIGIMADKDYKTVARLISTRCNKVITIPVNNPRAINNKVLADYMKQYCDNTVAEDNLEKAFYDALDFAQTDGGIIVCGSFYMASEMRKIIKIWVKSK